METTVPHTGQEGSVGVHQAIVRAVGEVVGRSRLENMFWCHAAPRWVNSVAAAWVNVAYDDHGVVVACVLNEHQPVEVQVLGHHAIARMVGVVNPEAAVGFHQEFWQMRLVDGSALPVPPGTRIPVPGARNEG